MSQTVCAMTDDQTQQAAQDFLATKDILKSEPAA